MPRYRISVGVTAVQGSQEYAVVADSEEEALVEFEANGGQFLEEEIEVMDHGEPEVLGVIT